MKTKNSRMRSIGIFALVFVLLTSMVLPLTAAGQVNMIITEMGVMEITPEGIVLTEINPEFTVEQVQEATEAKLIISENLKQVNLN